ncbi:MAG: hypothetical protein AAF664_19205 [Planctomycetota bacterium]
MPELLHQCMTKATTAEGDQRKHGPNWVISRRASLKVFEDRLECGDWLVEFSEIDRAVLYSFRSFIFRIPGHVLTIETDKKTYHFGLNGWGPFWKGSLPFDIERENGKLSFTWFSIIVRAVMTAYIAYVVWRWLFAS